MKINTLSCLLAVAGLGIHGETLAATMAVDWLKLGAGGSPSSFSLVDDGGAPLVGGRLVVEQGFSLPGNPSARTLANEFWAVSNGFADSQLGDSTVEGLSVRVGASGGPASYRMEFSVPEGRELVLMIGDLFSGAGGKTAGVFLSASSDSGAATISLAGIYDWSSGVSSLTEDLAWDAAAGYLSTLDGSNGDSSAAFFTIGPVSGGNAKIVLEIPAGLATTAGDAITVAIGLRPVPEPASALLLISGLLPFGLRRKRC